MKIVLIDNYDSFTYNLSHLVKELGAEVDILKNNEFTLDQLECYDGILLSPGPGLPNEAGLLLDVIKAYSGRKAILGICLGEQAIAKAFGGTLTNLNKVYHGIQDRIRILKHDLIFHNLPSHLLVGRYHSWVVSSQNFPECMEILAVSQDENIMAIRHKTYPVIGIQFHPESILTPDGKAIISNWFDFFVKNTTVRKNIEKDNLV